MSTSGSPRSETLPTEHRTQRARLHCRAHWASGPSQASRGQAIETETHRTSLVRGPAAGPARDLRSPGWHDRGIGVLQAAAQHRSDAAALKARVVELEDDLAAARTSLRRMIRTENLAPARP